jgi:hypothetical protein
MAYTSGGYAVNKPSPNIAKGGGGVSTLPLLTGFTAISGAFAQYQQGKARKIISESNKEMADIQAKAAIKGGEKAEAQSRQRYKKLLGKQRAAMAAQGISLTGGSAQDIQQETQDISELDALTIKMNAAREAFGFESRGRGFGMQGQFAQRAGTTGAISTLLTGGLKSYEQHKRGL